LRFLERKPGIRVSAGYVARLLERLTKSIDAGRPLWFDEDMVHVYARVFLACVDRDPAFEEAARAFLDAWRASYYDFGGVPESLRALMLRLRHYNAIQALLRPRLGSDAGGEPATRLLAEIRTLVDASADQALLACWASVEDASLHRSLLEKLELTDRTVGIFEASPEHHRRAAEHHLAKGEWRSAAAVHLRWREKADAAAIHEAQGEPRLACRLYREAGAYERLLECARRAGDEPEMARAYEGLGQVQRAIDTWASLGRTREVERLRRKSRLANAAQGDGDKPAQLSLFESD